jgi:thiol-disulfide isomerase/thioredoxin
MTFYQFVEQATENQSHFQTLYNQTKIPPEQIPNLEMIGLKAPYWLLIGDDWCIDCVAFAPVAARLAEASKVQLKLFKRSDHPELAETYKHHNKVKTPALVFFDQRFNEVGRWIERPKAAQQYVNELGRENTKEAKKTSVATGKDYEDVLKDLKTDMKKKIFTAYLANEYTNDAIEEMTSILEHGISK